MWRWIVVLSMGGVLAAGCKGASTTPTGPTPAPPLIQPPPVTPPTPPGGTAPPPQPGVPPPGPTEEVVPVSEVLRRMQGGDGPGTVVMEGQNIRDTSDNDEKVFSDGTGEVVVDYPSSNIAPLNVRIRVLGRIVSSEVDAQSWTPIR